jgi:hypothetical protein
MLNGWKCFGGGWWFAGMGENRRGQGVSGCRVLIQSEDGAGGDKGGEGEAGCARVWQGEHGAPLVCSGGRKLGRRDGAGYWPAAFVQSVSEQLRVEKSG